jgi:hypothetical protein
MIARLSRRQSVSLQQKNFDTVIDEAVAVFLHFNPNGRAR